MRKLVTVVAALAVLAGCSSMQPACGCIEPEEAWPPVEEPEEA
ncbi:hypothetical protein [Parvularcula lutaonensis]|uniref:Lipoprotein n=1 Tax=Parvularcula lutaonensis TaxID=491923 RepID=A0ABV7M7U9_9PROT|nr:hypothetical protein [Parvularcula lutaonensis]